MLNQSVAKRYAKAFLLLAQEKNSVPQYQEELQLVSEHISSIDGFTDYLRSFLVPPEEKKELFKRAFSAVVSLSTMNFINLVIDKRRESLLLEIYEIRKFLRSWRSGDSAVLRTVSIHLKKFLRETRKFPRSSRESCFHPFKEVFEVVRLYSRAFGLGSFHPFKEVFEGK